MGALRDLLDGGEPAILDGALATELEAHGHDLGDRLWSARLLADDPGAITAVHRSYRAAGAQVLTTASYQASIEGFTASGRPAAEAERLLRRSVELARGVADGALVAASCGPFGAMLAGGQEYSGDYAGASDQAVEDFHARRLERPARGRTRLCRLRDDPTRERSGRARPRARPARRPRGLDLLLLPRRARDEPR